MYCPLDASNILRMARICRTLSMGQTLHQACHMNYLIYSFQHLYEVNSVTITSSMDVETEYGLDSNGLSEDFICSSTFHSSTVARRDRVTSFGQWTLSRSETQFFRIEPVKSQYVLLPHSPSSPELE